MHAISRMDRDEVMAAMGKPDRKVRERDSNGSDAEDRISGHPRTDRVHAIHQ